MVASPAWTWNNLNSFKPPSLDKLCPRVTPTRSKSFSPENTGPVAPCSNWPKNEPDLALYSRPEPWVKDVLAHGRRTPDLSGQQLFLSHQGPNTTLWEQCGVQGPVDVQTHCYEPMDRLLQRQVGIQKALARKHLQEGQLVLYDITSSYFEGQYEESEIVAFGYNRDGKRKHEQMVIGLICNQDGCPVGVEVFAGNTQDATTVPAKIREVQQRYGIKKLIFVGDRGMVTQANYEKVKDWEGLWTISALTHQQILDLLERKLITPELFDERKVVEVIDPDNRPALLSMP